MEKKSTGADSTLGSCLLRKAFLSHTTGLDVASFGPLVGFFSYRKALNRNSPRRGLLEKLS